MFCAVTNSSKTFPSKAKEIFYAETRIYDSGGVLMRDSLAPKVFFVTRIVRDILRRGANATITANPISSHAHSYKIT